MYKYTLTAWFILCLCVSLYAQDGGNSVHRFTLEQCIEYALVQNNSLKNLKLTEQSNLESYKQARRDKLPSVSGSLDEAVSHSSSSFVNTGTSGSSIASDIENPKSTSFSGSVGLSSNLTLYKGGSINNTILQAKLQAEQAQYKTSQYNNQLKVKILNAFLSILENEELLKYEKTVLKTSEEQLKQAKVQYRLGKILESDYLLLESQYETDKNNVRSTGITRDNNLLSLKNLLSLDPTEKLEIISPDTNAVSNMGILPAVNYVVDRTLKTMPDMKISQYDVDIAKTSIKLAKANILPTVSMYASLASGHNDFNRFFGQFSDRFNQSLGISVSIPIFDKGQTRSDVKKDEIALQQAENDKKQSELDLKQTVVEEYNSLVSSYNLYNATNVKQNAYNKSYEAYNEKFKAGSITAVELLQQKNNYISALNDFVQSKYSFMLQRKILDVYMGEPVTM